MRDKYGLLGEADINQERLTNEYAAAELLEISVKTLRKWRGEGVGPTYVKLGRSVRYRLGDLTRFIEKNSVQNGVETNG
jgi:predicted site-specific integrase-resolvase